MKYSEVVANVKAGFLTFENVLIKHGRVVAVIR